MLIFQSTLPRRERPTAAGSLLLPFDFNPRSRKGSDNISALKILKQIISIHAPAKGATKTTVSNVFNSVFQSTLLRRERLEPAELMLIRYLFQSTLPRRERRCSITGLSSLLSFQSTLPRRERRDSFYCTACRYLFQSTLPRRERQQYCTKNLFIFIQYRQ